MNKTNSIDLKTNKNNVEENKNKIELKIIKISKRENRNKILLKLAENFDETNGFDQSKSKI